MTTTTHIASACIITVVVIKSGIGTLEAFLVAACASCMAHLLLDIIPHGFIAAPDTIFKKLVPTLLELGPGVIILVSAMNVFGSPLLFLWTAGFGILPDIVSTLLWKRQERFSAIPGFAVIHRAHRIVHWFEKDNSDGTVSYRFPNPPLLAAETVLIITLVSILFISFAA